MFCVARKLGKICKEMRGWSKSSFGNISKENKSTKKKLESLQIHLAHAISIAKHQQEERDCWDKWKMLLNHEEIFFGNKDLGYDGWRSVMEI